MEAKLYTIVSIAFIVVALSESKSVIVDNSIYRPSHNDHAGMARYLVHKSNWTSMGTISTAFKGYPMVNVKSIADSALGEKSTGNIYFMLTNLDFTGKDLMVNNKLTALFSEDQDLSCTMNNIDTMEPTCARAIFIGTVRKLKNNTDEFNQANEAFISRHPAAKVWRGMHDFYFCKFDIEKIAIIDYYGGANYVTAEDYYNANYDSNDYEFNNV